MKIKFSFVSAVAVLFLLAALAPNQGFAAKPNCDDPNSTHPQCVGDDGGSGGIEKVPSIITFDDDFPGTPELPGDPGIKSDDGAPEPYHTFADTTYVDGDNGVEAFIGSSAKTGDIILKLPQDPNDDRHIALNTGGGQFVECGDIPNGLVVAQGLVVAVSADTRTKQGVYDMGTGEGEISVVPAVTMRVLIRTLDDPDQLWFLNYGTGERKLCGDLGTGEGNDRVKVTMTGSDSNNATITEGDIWEVEAPAGSYACLEKHGSGGGNKTKFCGSYLMPFHFDIKPIPKEESRRGVAGAVRDRPIDDGPERDIHDRNPMV